MARFAAKLGSYTYDRENPHPTLDELEPATWARLEDVLGKPISARLRAEVVDLSDTYMHWRHAERHSKPVSEANAVLQELVDAIAKFNRVAYGELFQRNDAAAHAEGWFSEALADVRVRIDPRRVECIDPDNDGDDWSELSDEACAYKFRMTPDADFLTNLGIALSVAAEATETKAREFENDKRGFAVGRSLSDWIYGLKMAFKAAGLPHSELIEGHRAAPFACFVRALHNSLPDGGDSSASDDAMGLRIRRALAQRRKATNEREACQGGQIPSAEATEFDP